MSSRDPLRVTALRGNVTRGLYGVGSKSEREAAFIETSDGKYILRRKEGPAFGDDTLLSYTGHVVECDGFIVGTTLLAERIEVIE